MQRQPPIPAEQQRRARSRLVLMSAPLAAVAGAAVAAVVYLAARKAGVSMLVPVDPRDPGSTMVPIGLVGVLVSSVFPAFAGAIALALLTRTSRPLTWFGLLAIVLVGASAGPLLFGQAESVVRMDGATRHALAGMHVARALVVVWVLARGYLARPPGAGG
ncbi:MAG TPA: DUF6069 family protein [Anaeromyxobacteraceae bacterium]|nr:DUF6069 family protein [Anaeromyxobacteraceae bacterium]